MKRIYMMMTACLLLMCMLFSGCAKEPIAHDVTVMTIDGEAVTMKDYRYYYLSLKSQFDNGSDSYWKNNKEARTQLKALTEQYLLQYTAYDKILADNNYTANEAELKNTDEYIAEMREYYKTEEEFQKLLSDNYMTEDDYKAYVLRTAILNRYLYDYNREKNAAEMEKHLEKYVRVKHVLVKYGGTDGRSQAEAKKIAEQVAKDARAGADFDGLVKEFGEDPGMENNIDGYYFTNGKMVEEFEKASFALKDGEVSDPVESSYGYHVIVRLPMEESYLQMHFGEIFTEDKFYEAFDKELEETIDALDVKYEKIYNQIDIETVL